MLKLPKIARLLAALVATMWVHTSHAALILDASPETLGFGDPFSASNRLDGQSFATLFSVAGDTTLTGIDSYTRSETYAVLGFDVTVRVFADDGGSVGALLHQQTSLTTIVDGDGAGDSGFFRRFAPINFDLGAGSYWIGMTGTSAEFAQTLLGFTSPPNVPDTIQFNGGTLTSTSAIGGVASIRVYADTSTAQVPAPATLLLLSLGILCLRLRRR